MGIFRTESKTTGQDLFPAIAPFLWQSANNWLYRTNAPSTFLKKKTVRQPTVIPFDLNMIIIILFWTVFIKQDNAMLIRKSAATAAICCFNIDKIEKK